MRPSWCNVNRVAPYMGVFGYFLNDMVIFHVIMIIGPSWTSDWISICKRLQRSAKRLHIAWKASMPGKHQSLQCAGSNPERQSQDDNRETGETSQVCRSYYMFLTTTQGSTPCLIRTVHCLAGFALVFLPYLPLQDAKNMLSCDIVS